MDYAYDPTIPNVLGQVFSTDQAGFLAGYLAAGVTKTGKVGYVWWHPDPDGDGVHGRICAGCKALQQAEGHERRSASAGTPIAQTGLFTGNFESTDDGRTMGETLMDEGADIIMPVAGPVGLGTAAAVKDRGNAYMIGVNSDWYLTAPD